MRRTSTWMGAVGDDLALLKDAEQLHLNRERSLADLVQEERSAARDLEHAVLVAYGAGEASLHVAEELALEEVLRQRAAVDRNERIVRPAAAVMDRPRDELLPRAALAADENRAVGIGHLVHEAEHPLDLLALADDLLEIVPLLELLLEKYVLVFHPVHVEGVPDDHLDLVVFRALDEIVERAAVEGVDGGLRRSVRRHDDDRQRGVRLFHRREKLDSVHSLHLDVGDDDVETRLLDLLERLFAVVHGLDVVPLLAKHDGEILAHVLLVIDDENLLFCHSNAPPDQIG
jgi:hypothetical protein